MSLITQEKGYSFEVGIVETIKDHGGDSRRPGKKPGLADVESGKEGKVSRAILEEVVEKSGQFTKVYS